MHLSLTHLSLPCIHACFLLSSSLSHRVKHGPVGYISEVMTACIPRLQDTWVIHEGLAGGANALFCVFDGHGMEGEKCSRQVASQLPSLLVHSANFKVTDFSCPG